MAIEHVSRQAVERRLVRLQRDYDDVPVVVGDKELEPDQFADFREVVEDGFTGGGYAWVVRQPRDAPPLGDSPSRDVLTNGPHVLLVLQRDTYGQTWQLPGGGREADETYEEAAEREVAEETGIEIDVGEPFLAYHAHHRPADGRDVRLHTLYVAFDATYEEGRIDVQHEELRGGAWVFETPETLGPWAQYRAVDWWDDYDPDERWWE